jgi:translation initiation factor 2A
MFRPLFQWNENESKCGICVNKSLHLYDNNMKFEMKVKSSPVYFFQIAPNGSYAICTKSNDSSFVVHLHKFNSFKSCGTCLIPNGDKVDMFWNRQGTVLLILVSMDVDKSFYGGKSQLFFSKLNEVGKPFVSNKDNTYDVKWNPKGTEFIVVHGYPQKATLFDEHMKELGTFESGKMNCSFWNPFSKLFLLGGLEGMNGDVEVIDRKKLKKIGAMHAKRGCRVLWSPDGRLILGKTVQSILKVDNGFQIYKYNGLVLLEKSYSNLMFASWKPVINNTYVFNPPSPRGLNQSKQVEKKIEIVEKVYVPPHLRNKEPEPKKQTKSPTNKGQNKPNSNGNSKSDQKPKQKSNK